MGAQCTHGVRRVRTVLGNTQLSHPQTDPHEKVPDSDMGTKKKPVNRHLTRSLQSEPRGLQSKGAFPHSAGTARAAPNITLFIPGTPLKTNHLQKHA